MKRYIDTYTGKAHVFSTPCGRHKCQDNSWANRVYALLRKDAPKWEGFSFMPKGEVV